jgi:hypothetical protein
MICDHSPELAQDWSAIGHKLGLTGFTNLPKN